MRVSRYIYIIGVVALALQGCNRDSHPSTPEPEQAIGMAATAVVSGTRALFNNTADLASFRVSGHKVGTSNEKVFEHQLVSRDGSEWDYSPIRYWDKLGTYAFGAYAPADMEGKNGIAVEYDYGSKPNIYTMTIPQWQVIDGSGSEQDIIVAASTNTARKYLDDHAGTVNLEFDHIYAQLQVQVLRNAFLASTYKLQSVAYMDAPKDGTWGTYTYDFATPANSAYAITLLSDDATMGVMNGDVLVESTATLETTFKHLVVPFTTARADGFRIKLSYTINGTSYTATVNSGLKTIEAGHSYALRLSFNSGADIIPSVTMEEWVDENIDEDDDMHNW